MIKIVLLLGGVSLLAATLSVGDSREATDVDILPRIKISMRDEVILNATLYRPSNLTAPAPCVVTLTPYIADSSHPSGIYFASHGYPFMSVDVRGRGNSEGTFRPFIQESDDGYDVVEWLAKQPYCNGKVAMWGGSYVGYDQWATAKALPPHLATIVPTASVFPGIDFPARNNIFYPYDLQWLTYISGHTLQERLFRDGVFWSTLYRKWYQSGRAFRDLDSAVGPPYSTFHVWLAHPEASDYWDSYTPNAEQYSRIRIPVLTITGSYDDDQPGALEYYRRHMQSAVDEARSSHYLIIGPWDHAGTRAPSDQVGGIKLGPESLIDIPQLHLDWYSWTMAGGPKPEFLKARVAYYVMGEEHWHYANTLEEVTAELEPYFLDSETRANDVFSSGSLGKRPGRSSPDTYRFDPREVNGPEVEAEARASGGALTDQTVLFALQRKVLVYHSAPFAKDTEISGFFKLDAWISIDCPDTDLYASVYEIGADGESVRLSTDAIRARYREGLRRTRLIRTRNPLRYRFDHFTFVSRLVRRGHRLRLLIAPMGRLIEATFAEKNYQGGGVVADESVKDARPVTVGLFHDKDRPSVLYVPIGRVR